MGVRRQLDKRADSVSLRRLLGEMAQKPQILSRQRHVIAYAVKLMGGGDTAPSAPPPDGEVQGGAYALTRSEAEHIANESFDKYADRGNPHMPPSVIQQDLADLEKQGNTVKTFATKKVAHLDENPPAALPTFDELDACVDFLERLVLKYELILKTSASCSLLPTRQYDWKAIFYEPWIPRP